MNQTIILNGKTYERVSNLDKWLIETWEDCGYLILKELPSSPPKEEFPKVFDGILWKFYVNENGSIDRFKYVTKEEYYSSYQRPEDEKEYQKAVDCAEKIREGMK